MALQITLKPLRGQVFRITSEQGDTIKDLKRKVGAQSPEFPEALQQLIYQGRILKDGDIVSELGVMPNQFIVVMLTKAKPGQKPVAGPAARPAPVGCPAEPAEPAAAASAASLRTARAAMEELPDSAEDPQSPCQEGLRPDGGAPPAASRAAQRAAAQAAPSIAAHAPPGAAPESQALARRAQPFPNPDAIGAGTATAQASQPLPPVLAELRDSPQFASMARRLLQEPQAFGYLLPSLLQGKPDLAQAIQDNFPSFLQLVQEVGSRPWLSEGNWDEMLASNPELLEEMMPVIEANDPEMAEAIRSDPASFLAIFQHGGEGIIR